MSSFVSDVADGPAEDADGASGSGRERDSAELPEPMRRDVRLLGDVLGEVISESAGADLLADVERLRHAVIAARSAADRGSAEAAAAGDEITALVASWSWERAELVARAFTVYFHLVNLAEEQQRVRTLRLRDSGDRPPRESFADAAARLTAEGGAGAPGRAAGRAACAPGVHRAPDRGPPPRGGRVPAPRQRAAHLGRRPAGGGRRGRRRTGGSCARRSTCCGGPAQLRVAGMTPADEVRSVMTAFDETLFRLVPAVYRALDHVLLGAASGAERRRRCRRSCGSAPGSAATGTATRTSPPR